jgi:hypothetical protein
MLAVSLFPRKLAFIFDFLAMVLLFVLDPSPNPVPEPECITVPLRQKVVVPAVPASVPQRLCYVQGFRFECI